MARLSVFAVSAAIAFVVITRFVSSIDTVKAEGVRKTPLMLTSQYSRKLSAPYAESGSSCISFWRSWESMTSLTLAYATTFASAGT